jgi:hypothetical protein
MYGYDSFKQVGVALKNNETIRVTPDYSKKTYGELLQLREKAFEWLQANLPTPAYKEAVRRLYLIQEEMTCREAEEILMKGRNEKES